MDNNSFENGTQNTMNNDQVRPYQQYEQNYQTQQTTNQQYQSYQPYNQAQTFNQAPAYQPIQNPAFGGNSNLEEPVSIGDWLLTTFICVLPCIGLIMLFVWGFGSGTNKSKANYCKTMLIWKAIGIVLSIVFSIVFSAATASIISELGL